MNNLVFSPMTINLEIYIMANFNWQNKIVLTL